MRNHNPLPQPKKEKEPTFREIIDRFTTEHDVNEISRQNYRNWLIPFERWIVDTGRNPRKLSKKDCIDYKHFLQGTRTDKTGNCYLSAVKIFYRWANDQGLVADNPTDGVAQIRISRKYRKKPLTLPQVETLLQSCDLNTWQGKRAKLIIELMIVTGLRAIEVSRLEKKDIENNELMIQGKGRTDKDIRLPIPQQLADDLRTTDGKIFVFETNQRNQLTSSRISAIIRNQMKIAGVKSSQITTHSLRHTAGSLTMLQTNNNPWAVQRMLRHSSLKTSEIYIASLREDNSIIQDVTGSIFGMIRPEKGKKE